MGGITRSLCALFGHPWEDGGGVGRNLGHPWGGRRHGGGVERDVVWGNSPLCECLGDVTLLLKFVEVRLAEVTVFGFEWIQFLGCSLCARVLLHFCVGVRVCV